MRSFLFLFLFSVVLVETVSIPSAVAQTDEEKAKDCYERGQRLYDLGNYKEAIEQFKQGYLWSGLPAFLLNIAQAYRKNGDIDNAIDYYKRFIAKAEEDDPAIESAKNVIIELEAQKAGTANPYKDTTPTKNPSLGTPGLYKDGGLTQAEIQIILGTDYDKYVTSQLTLEGYTQQKKGKRSVWLGSLLAGTGVALGVTLLAINQDENTGVRTGAFYCLYIGGIGGVSLASKGIVSVQQSKTKIRPVGAKLALSPTGVAVVGTF